MRFILFTRLVARRNSKAASAEHAANVQMKQGPTHDKTGKCGAYEDKGHMEAEEEPLLEKPRKPFPPAQPLGDFHDSENYTFRLGSKASIP